MGIQVCQPSEDATTSKIRNIIKLPVMSSGVRQQRKKPSPRTSVLPAGSQSFMVGIIQRLCSMVRRYEDGGRNKKNRLFMILSVRAWGAKGHLSKQELGQNNILEASHGP